MQGLRKISISLLLALLLSLPLLSLATPIFEVFLPDHEAKATLVSGNYDVLEVHEDYALVSGWTGVQSKLSSDGLSYTVFIDNYEEHISSIHGTSLDDMAGYPTLDEIEEWWAAFYIANMNIVSQLDTIGYSVENRPLVVFKISDNPNTEEDGETEVFINATMHAREVAVPVLTMNFCEHLTENYGTDDRVTALVDSHELWFQIIVNPDGYVYNEIHDPDGGGMYRKNRQPPEGVDLNRNWPYMWGYDDVGSSPEPFDITYRGQSPGSEPETQALMDFINSHEFASVMNYHSYSNLLLIPWGYTFDELHPDHEIYMAYGNYVCETLDYVVGAADAINYTANGGCDDWQGAGGLEDGADYEMWGFVFEVGSGYENGDYVGFWPSFGLAQTYAEEHIEPMMRFCEVAHNPHMLLAPDAPLVALPDTVTTSFTLSWSPVIDTLGNQAIAYDVAEMAGLTTEDGAEDGSLIAWEMDGFMRSAARQNDGVYSYWSNTASDLYNTMTATMPYLVRPFDILSMYVNYEIELDWDYAYVQVSTDGSTFENLAGNITTNTSPNNANLGNGITGNSNGWVEAAFPLDSYAGEYVTFRIAYVSDTYTNEIGIFVDDISPIMGFEAFDEIAEAIPDTFLALEYPDLTEMTERWYAVRGIDERGDVGFWSNPMGTLIDPQTSGVDVDGDIPLTFSVSEVYPNPFNPSTSVRMTIPDRSNVTIVMHDILGREVKTVMHSAVEAGAYTYSVDASDLASGLYFLVVNANCENGINHRAVKKAILMK